MTVAQLDETPMKRSPRAAAGPANADAERESLSEGRSVEELLFWIDCLGAPVLVVERHTLTIRHANECAAAFFLRQGDSFAGRSVGEIVGGEAELMLAQVWSNSPVGRVGEPFIIRSVVDGQERALMVRATRIVADGEMLRLFTFSDAPPEGPLALAGWQANMMEILNWFPFGFEIANNDDQIQFANAQCRKLFGYDQHQLQSAEDWWHLAYPDPEYRAFARQKWETEIRAARADNRGMTPFDLDVATASGEFRTIQFHHRTIGNFNINLFLDVTRERAYERELRTLAGTDPLTGAMNRRRFFEEAAPFFAADADRPVAVLLLDIDRFKDINDAYGHGIGDIVLQEFTRRCAGMLRSGDRLARFGGEEFAVLLPGSTPEAAAQVAERLRTGMEGRSFEMPEARLSVTTSVGGTCRVEGDTLDAAISRADEALYEAKRSGRNRVVMVQSRQSPADGAVDSRRA